MWQTFKKVLFEKPGKLSAGALDVVGPWPALALGSSLSNSMYHVSGCFSIRFDGASFPVSRIQRSKCLRASAFDLAVRASLRCGTSGSAQLPIPQACAGARPRPLRRPHVRAGKSPGKRRTARARLRRASQSLSDVLRVQESHSITSDYPA